VITRSSPSSLKKRGCVLPAQLGNTLPSIRWLAVAVAWSTAYEPKYPTLWLSAPRASSGVISDIDSEAKGGMSGVMTAAIRPSVPYMSIPFGASP